MSEFVEECRQEWRRLGVPDPIANEMAADLTADIEEAEAEGGSAEDVLGAASSTRAASPRLGSCPGCRFTVSPEHAVQTLAGSGHRRDRVCRSHRLGRRRPGRRPSRCRGRRPGSADLRRTRVTPGLRTQTSDARVLRAWSGGRHPGRPGFLDRRPVRVPRRPRRPRSRRPVLVPRAPSPVSTRPGAPDPVNGLRARLADLRSNSVTARILRTDSVRTHRSRPDPIGRFLLGSRRRIRAAGGCDGQARRQGGGDHRRR